MPLAIQGRFFERDGERIFLRAVTYGPFPPASQPDAAVEFPRIREAGFHAVRLYEAPDLRLLDLAEESGLSVLATVPWHWNSLFTRDETILADARRKLSDFLHENGNHPALGGLLIANEIRPDLVRFMGPVVVRDALEGLIDHCREIIPALPLAYANFPTTEYLEPRNADFTAFNVYLEKQEDFARYLRRLQNIAGDRPVLLSEFGLNTHPRDEDAGEGELEARQARTLAWAIETTAEEALAGFTVYSWSDRWMTAGEEVTDWSFGLTRRDGSEKPALAGLREWGPPPPSPGSGRVSIALCTRNGAQRLRENLRSFEAIEDENFELVVIDDGSTDDTRTVTEEFARCSPLQVRYFYQKPGGLSVARNHAARVAEGEFIAYIDDDARPYPFWLRYLREAFARNPRAAAAGGPNLPPEPTGLQNAVVAASPGNVSHVLFTDTTAEHLPGCNLALRREILLAEGGFDERFHAAGDDVDICWRLLDSGYDLAFHPAACVSHDRRSTIRKFIRQQTGYGEAEGMLFQKHPQRFGADGIRWEGVIYTGSPLTPENGSVIYHGPMGEAPFQMLHPAGMPPRPLPFRYDFWLARQLVRLADTLARRARRRQRRLFGGPVAYIRRLVALPAPPRLRIERSISHLPFAARQALLARLLKEGWQVCDDPRLADLEKDGFRLMVAETPYDHGLTDLHYRLDYPAGAEAAGVLAEIGRKAGQLVRQRKIGESGKS